MSSILAAFLSSLLISFIAIPSIIKAAELKNLFDKPGTRASHEKDIPTLGGIAIFAGFALSLNFWGDFSNLPEIQYILCATMLMFFTGLKDDLVHLVAYKKFLSQVIAAIILITWGDIRLTSLYGIFGVYEITYPISFILSLLTIVGITNSFNLIDGVNTLAAGLGILISATFGGWFYLNGFYQYSLIAFALTGSLCGFLYYNWTPAKIFMGDTGSLIMGIICSLLAIKFIEINRTSSIIPSAPAVAIGIMMIPLFDTLRVMLIRLKNKKSPFSPDKNHIHHILLNKGFSHIQTTIILLLINLGFIIFSFKSNIQDGEILLTILLILASLIFIIFEKAPFQIGPKRDLTKELA